MGTSHVTSCGVERWPVKVLGDRDRNAVVTDPVAATIRELRLLDRPTAPLPPDTRVPPHELRTYRVTAIVSQVLVESDGDWHLVLADPEAGSQTMIAEIPDSACALGTGWESKYAAARRALRTLPRRALVDIDGVGFFDVDHGQRGRAPNDFELHPVLALQAH